MPRWSLFVIFFTIALLILGGVHFYFYRRLVVAPSLPEPWRTAAKVALVLATLSFPVSFFIARSLNITTARWLLYPAYVWLGTMLMLFFLLVAIDIVRGILWLGYRLAGHKHLIADPQRRLFLARAIAGVAGGTVLIGTGIALWRGLGRPLVKRIEIVLPKLPPALDGFSIVQLTDLHLGAMRRGPWVQQVVARTNELDPDLIAITGDLADATPGQLSEEVAMLGKLKAKQGVFFVTGNHEYFIDLEGWLQQLAELQVRVLRNERVTISRGKAVFDLAGVDDHEGARLARGHGANVAQAMNGRDPNRAVVLLAHQPRVIKDAAENDVGLVLCGHTHGGQIWPWNYLVYLQQPYVKGLHEHRGTQIYVSQGTGFWGPPMRLGSRSEITQVILRSENHQSNNSPTKRAS